MAEPTAQVHVSLIERARDAIGSVEFDADTWDRLNALLSQPTAERDDLLACLGIGDDGYNRWDTDALDRLLERLMKEPTAEPPRIEDMAPGTTEDSLDAAWNEYTADSRGKGLLFGMDKSPREAFIVGFRAGSRIDPSTIRDVTPPNESTK